MKPWIERAWWTAELIPFMPKTAVAEARFSQGCLALEATFHGVRSKGRRAIGVAVVLVAMGSSQFLHAEWPTFDIQAFAQRTQKEVKDNWRQLQKENWDTARFLKTVFITYKQVQMAQRIYERVKNGDINMLISGLMPTITLETEDWGTTKGPDGEPTLAKKIDTVVIRPVPTYEQRKFIQRNPKYNFRTKTKLKDYFGGNFFEMLDVDVATNYVTPSGQKLATTSPKEIEEMATLDAITAYIFAQNELNLGMGLAVSSAQDLGDTLDEQIRNALDIAYQNVMDSEKAYGVDSPQYQSALTSYYAALNAYRAPRSTEDMAGYSNLRNFKMYDGQAQALAESIGGDSMALQMSQQRATNSAGNLQEIQKRYGSAKLEKLTFGALMSDGDKMEVNKETFGMQQKMVALLNSIYTELQEINRRSLKDGVAQGQEKMRGVVQKQQEEVQALAAKIADTKSAIAVQKADGVAASIKYNHNVLTPTVGALADTSSTSTVDFSDSDAVYAAMEKALQSNTSTTTDTQAVPVTIKSVSLDPDDEAGTQRALNDSIETMKKNRKDNLKKSVASSVRKGRDGLSKIPKSFWDGISQALSDAINRSGKITKGLLFWDVTTRA